jgi:hypothetical protein
MLFGNVATFGQEAQNLFVRFLPGKAVWHVSRERTAKDHNLPAQIADSPQGDVYKILYPRFIYRGPGYSQAWRYKSPPRLRLDFELPEILFQLSIFLFPNLGPNIRYGELHEIIPSPFS